MFVLGHLFAAIMGLTLPIFQIFMADSFNAFGENSKEAQLKEIERITIILISIAAGMWFVGYLYWVLLSQFSYRVANRIKKRYLEAILRQECAWFDQTNYTELSAKISRECQAIQRGLSEKAGTVTMNVCMFLSGLAVGFYMGWAMALALMVLVPVIGLIGWLYQAQMS
jgi:ABC-type multidrug transport system fused ATPase/permease subunit